MGSLRSKMKFSLLKAKLQFLEINYSTTTVHKFDIIKLTDI